MPINYNADVSIVNEGTSKYERYVVKVTKLAGIEGEEFIKTFHFPNSRLNIRAINALNADTKQNKNLFLGIALQSYQYHNYIHFYSTYRLFPLAKFDSIIFYFDNDVKMEFEFSYSNKVTRYLTSNLLPINDDDFHFLATNKLLQWKMTNKRKDAELYGGFIQQDGNPQYFDEASGQNLFMTMAKEILAIKPKLVLMK
jgi:hypothetical protein